MAKPNGAILWEGASLIDGAPIVAIVTGLARPSDNAKTGNMLQTWILRADVSPLDAIRDGRDVSICGACIHRGDSKTGRKRSCYVQVAQAPLQVWKTYKAGKYPKRDALGLGAGRSVRLGAYGDPAAVPVSVWQGLVSGAVSWTGYTHQWRAKRLASPELMALCQASVDSAQDLQRARSKGYGTFRVLRRLDVLGSQEIHCPADKGLTDCATCGLCNGAKAKNVAIPSHGAGAANYESA